MSVSASLPPGGAVHIVGIGGVMMSAIARLLARQGCTVTGSDMQAGDYTRALAAEGIPVHIGHAAGNLPARLDLVARSSAIRDDNPEVVAARARGVPVLKRDAVLGEVVNPLRGIAISGTHGKTTTCALTAVLLTEAGVDPTFLIGTNLANYGTNARVGASDWVVVEADEYDRALLALRPRIAVVLNLEHDHPDIYADLADLTATFEQFVDQTHRDGLVLLGADSPPAAALASSAAAPVQTYGFADGADWRVSEFAAAPDGIAFQLTCPAGERLRVTAPLVGRHNALNATAAIAVAAAVGVPPAEAAELLRAYRGAERRLEVVGRRGGVTIIDDYAHHPSEVRATIAAVRAAHPAARLRVIYEPHQYARTRALLADYAGAFDLADEARIVPIYQARETDTSGVDAGRLAAVAGGAEALESQAAAGEWLLAETAGEQVWLLMGAGTITQLAHRLAAELGA